MWQHDTNAGMASSSESAGSWTLFPGDVICIQEPLSQSGQVWVTFRSMIQDNPISGKNSSTPSRSSTVAVAVVKMESMFFRKIGNP